MPIFTKMPQAWGGYKGGEEAKAHQIADHNHRHAFRATHVKTQGLVKGTLTIPSGLSLHFSQGLFTHSSTSTVASRYANEPVFLHRTEPDLRSITIKILSVHGERLITLGNGNLSTQDFFSNNAP